MSNGECGSAGAAGPEKNSCAPRAENDAGTSGALLVGRRRALATGLTALALGAATVAVHPGPEAILVDACQRLAEADRELERLDAMQEPAEEDLGDWCARWDVAASAVLAAPAITLAGLRAKAEATSAIVRREMLNDVRDAGELELHERAALRLAEDVARLIAATPAMMQGSH